MHLVLSPHPDDTALCIGGMILEQKVKDFVVLNIFNRSCYTVDGDSDAESVSARRFAEEKLVMASLGLPFYMLDFEDSSLRVGYEDEGSYMNPDNDVTADPITKPCHEKIDQFITEKGPFDSIWAPLSIPSHIDHRIVSAYGIQKAQNGHNVIFYEDVGYDSSLMEGKVKSCVTGLPLPLQSRTVSLGSFARKLELISLYKSQMDAEMLGIAEKQFALRGGERIWGTESALQIIFD